MTVDAEVLAHLTDEEREELDGLLRADTVLWRPLPPKPGTDGLSPQQLAYESEADVTGYGGAAGGGKTDLACGLALTRHRTVGIFRQIGTELTSIVDRLGEIFGRQASFTRNGIWYVRTPDGVKRQIELGSFPAPKEERKYQGRPHDLKVFDEAANMRREAVLFLLGWMRTTTPGQRCRALLTFNPPTTVEGRWIIDYFAPWLDAKFGNPALPGELRYAASLPATEMIPQGREVWVEDGRAFVIREGKPCYEFDEAKEAPEDVIRPQSRTFIPSRVTDNPYLMKSGYIATLQALPEPLRSQMLYGDFSAGVKDDPWQILPTAWVEAAMERWTKKAAPGRMLSLGADIAQGGDDNTVIACRYEEMWFDEPIAYTGKQVPDGPTNAGYIVAATRNGAPQHIDLLGVGAKPYGHLMEMHQDVIGVDMGAPSYKSDLQGTMGFFNVRSELVWRMREALDPQNKSGIALPKSRILLQELCAFTWTPVIVRGRTAVKASSRDEVISRIGRSPDYATAYFLANIDTPREYTPSAMRESVSSKREYDPLAGF